MIEPATALELEQTKLRSMSAAFVANVLGMSRVTVLRSVIAQLENDGVLRRVGRRWLGSPANIEAWARGEWTPPKLAGRRGAP